MVKELLIVQQWNRLPRKSVSLHPCRFCSPEWEKALTNLI